MNKTTRMLFILFWVVVVLDLLFILLKVIAVLLGGLMLLLAFVSGIKQKSGRPFFLVLSALFLSWCGDLALQAKDLFIPGLLSFLLAHGAYIAFFMQAGPAGKGLVQGRPLLLLPVLAYIGLLLFFLFPFLGALRVPVILYSLIIGTMLLTALNTQNKLPSAAPAFFITGAPLFVLSDSLLAAAIENANARTEISAVQRDWQHWQTGGAEPRFCTAPPQRS